MSKESNSEYSADDIAFTERLASIGVCIENPKRPFGKSPDGVRKIVKLTAERTGIGIGNVEHRLAEACGKTKRSVQYWENKPSSVSSTDAGTIIDAIVELLVEWADYPPDPDGEADYLYDRYECEYYVSCVLCLPEHVPAPVATSRKKLLSSVLTALEFTHGADAQAVDDLLTSISLCLRAHPSGYGNLDATALDESVRGIMACGKSERGRAERIANEARERFGMPF